MAINGLEYIASYADLRAAFGANKAAGEAHFAASGAREGRVVTFDALECIEPGAGNSEPYEFVMLPGDVLV
jgi:hypothetical protein